MSLFLVFVFLMCVFGSSIGGREGEKEGEGGRERRRGKEGGRGRGRRERGRMDHIHTP